MSEPVHTSETPATGAPETPAPAPEQTPAPETPAEPKPTETVDYWKQRSRQNEERAAANAKAAERLKEIEDRDLSELQRAQRDRDELAAKYAELEQERLRTRVAIAKGHPELADKLTGSSEEELAAHADWFIAWRGNVPPTTPRPDPGQGPRPSTPEMESQVEYLKFFPDEAPKAR